MPGLTVGGVQLAGRALLAPLAGYGDIAFRRLCREYGAALTVTEMVSGKGLLYNNAHTAELLRLSPAESPSCVQLFGGEPDVFGKAVARPELAAFDIIDINMGCPVPKVTRNGEGSALARDIPRAARCAAAAVRAAGGRPVTAKIRLGFAENEFTAPALARALEEAGVAAITVHGRTAAQMYRGRADWDKIAAVKAAVTIPVIGNGDIDSAGTAERRLQTVDGIAVGRGALGHPDLFAEIAGGVGDGLKSVILRHFDYMLEYFPPRYTAVNMRKHLAYYLHGVPDTKELKQRLNRIDDAAAMRALLAAAL